jgi:predicted lipopolysaccharide heptosyltransferase III
VKILIIKLRYIGDTVLVTPLISAIMAGIHNGQVDVLVNEGTQDVLTDHPSVRRLWPLPGRGAKRSLWHMVGLIHSLRKEHYDMVIELTNNDRGAFLAYATGAPVRIGYRSKQAFRRKVLYNRTVDSVLGRVHTVDHHLKMAEELGLPLVDRNPHIRVPPEKMKSMEEQLLRLGLTRGEPFAIIHPGARRWYKSWPSERFSRLADRIVLEWGIKVILTGGKDDMTVCAKIMEQMEEEALNLADQVPLSELPALVEKALCLIGNDSAPVHIATAVGTPAIAIFGPTNWRVWQPRRVHDRTVAAEFPCMPCGHSRPHCPLAEGYCMNSISFEQVWKPVAETISSRMEGIA